MKFPTFLVLYMSLGCHAVPFKIVFLSETAAATINVKGCPADSPAVPFIRRAFGAMLKFGGETAELMIENSDSEGGETFVGRQGQALIQAVHDHLGYMAGKLNTVKNAIPIVDSLSSNTLHIACGISPSLGAPDAVISAFEPMENSEILELGGGFFGAPEGGAKVTIENTLDPRDPIRQFQALSDEYRQDKAKFTSQEPFSEEYRHNKVTPDTPFVEFKIPPSNPISTLLEAALTSHLIMENNKLKRHPPAKNPLALATSENKPTNPQIWSMLTFLYFADRARLISPPGPKWHTVQHPHLRPPRPASPPHNTGQTQTVVHGHLARPESPPPGHHTGQTQTVVHGHLARPESPPPDHHTGQTQTVVHGHLGRPVSPNRPHKRMVKSRLIPSY